MRAEIIKKLNASGIDYKSLLNTQLWLVGVDVRQSRLPLEIGFKRCQDPKTGFSYYSLETEQEIFDLHASGVRLSLEKQESDLFFPRYHFLPKRLPAFCQGLDVSVSRVCENFSRYQDQIHQIAGLKHQQATRKQWLEVNSRNVWFEPAELKYIWAELGEKVK